MTRADCTTCNGSRVVERSHYDSYESSGRDVEWEDPCDECNRCERCEGSMHVHVDGWHRCRCGVN